MAVQQEQRTTETDRAPGEPVDVVCPWCRGSVEPSFARDLSAFGHLWHWRTYRCWECNVDVRVDTPPSRPQSETHG